MSDAALDTFQPRPTASHPQKAILLPGRPCSQLITASAMLETAIKKGYPQVAIALRERMKEIDAAILHRAARVIESSPVLANMLVEVDVESGVLQCRTQASEEQLAVLVETLRTIECRSIEIAVPSVD